MLYFLLEFAFVSFMIYVMIVAMISIVDSFYYNRYRNLVSQIKNSTPMYRTDNNIKFCEDSPLFGAHILPLKGVIRLHKWSVTLPNLEEVIIPRWTDEHRMLEEMYNSSHTLRI